MKTSRPLGLAALILLGDVPFGQAQTDGSLNTQASQVWNTAPWMISSGPGTFPTAGGVATLLAQENTTVGFPPDLTVLTVTNPIALSGLQFQGAFRWRIQTGAGGSLALSASGATVSADLPDVGQRYIIQSPMSGGGAVGLTKVGAGTLTLSGANTYSGGTHVNGGVLEATGDGNLGAVGAGNGISLGGGSLRVSGSSFTTARVMDVAGGGGAIDSLVTGIATFNGAIGGANDLAVTAANGGVTFSADNPLGGVLSLGARFLLFNLNGANGAFRSASGYNFSGVLVNLDSTSANNNNRLSDTAPINAGNGGAIFLAGNSAVSTTEIAGALNVGGTFRLAVNANTGNQPSLNFASINRQNNAALFITGSNLGEAPGAFVAQITSAAAPAPLIGGGGAPGSSNINILPWMTGKNTISGGFDGMRHVTYDSGTTRLRPITTAEYAAAFGGSATGNVRLAASTAAPLSATVNALLFAPPSPATLSGGPINLTSGAFLHSPTSNFFPDFSTVSAGLNFGPAEGVIHATSNLELSGVISGSGGLTISPRGFTVRLSGASTYTGATHLYEGVTEVNGDIPRDGVTPNPFGLSTSPIVLHSGAILQFVGSGSRTARAAAGATPASNVNPGLEVAFFLNDIFDFGLNATIADASVVAQQAAIINGNINLQAPLKVEGGSTAVNACSLNGIISGPGPLHLAGCTEVNGNNTYQGGTTMESGATVRLGHDRALGTGPVTVLSGFNVTNIEAANSPRQCPYDMEYFGNVNFGGSESCTVTGEVRLCGSRRIAVSNSQPVIFAGKVKDGALRKEGSGTLELNCASGNDYTGGTIVSDGILSVNNSSGSGTGSGTIVVQEFATLEGVFVVGEAALVLGHLKPGNSAGVANFGSSLQLGTTAQVEMELASPASADKINVAGLLTLAGTVRVVALGGYVAQLGAFFDLFDWGALDASNFTLGNLDLRAPTAPGTAWDRSLFPASGSIQVAVDGDGDGLTDNNEITLFGTDPTRADTDGDGMNDGAEIRAGTTPNDPNSAFRIVAVDRPAAGSMSITWQSKFGKLYRLVRSGSPDFTTPTVVTANFAGSEPTSQFTDTTLPPASTKVFYRVELQ